MRPLPPIVDVHAWLGLWPFQRFAVRAPAALQRHLAREGISAAWVSAVESVLHPDPDACDGVLARRLAGREGLHFVKTVNPLLGGSLERLGQWVGARGVRAVKIVPNYHRCELTHPAVAALMQQVRRRRLVLLVQMRLEDERNQCPLMPVPGVPWKAVARLARSWPGVPIVALGAYLHEARRLARAGANLHVDLSFLEAPDTLAAALEHIPARQIVFGSHTPFFTTRSAVMKLAAADVPARVLRAVAGGNAARLLGRR